ncbi:MAG TPA: tetratricopeptide repeat protein [Rickettsia endosymbiont of Ceroptres masudai]|nr:tetratricopeptide repeat protein [Rickettsia endosymbiont of Ceroptres masudai]
MSLYNFGEYEESIIEYEKAIELHPNYAALYKNKGDSLYNLGRLEEAIKAYDNVIELEHDYEEAINNRAIVIQQIGSHNDGKVA